MLQKNLPSGKVFPVIFFRFWLDFISMIKFASEGKFKEAAAVSGAHFAFFGSLGKTNRKREKGKRKKDVGLYSKSIVWKYFAEAKKFFNDL